MRALKSVLVMAGSLKRANPDLDEDIVLIRAMRDSNIPKFLSEDARLFNAIVSDLFPDVEIPNQVSAWWGTEDARGLCMLLILSLCCTHLLEATLFVGVVLAHMCGT